MDSLLDTWVGFDSGRDKKGVLSLGRWSQHFLPGEWVTGWKCPSQTGASLVAQMVKLVCLQCGRPGFNPWVGKISWRGKWQPTPVFLPGKSHGLRILVRYSSRGRKESDTTERLHFLSLSGSVWKGKNRSEQLYGAVFKPKQIELFFQVSWTLACLCKFGIVLWGSGLGWTEWRSWKPAQNETHRILKGVTWYVSDSQDRSICC